MRPGSYIHLKTDSPNLYRFTKWVIELYDLPVIQDIEDVYGEGKVSDVLQIKTHYESLDIAQSNKVHYLQFMLPATPLPDKESALKLLLLEEESDRRS
jgi:tRNA (guanine-N7-)-methyltransferase